MAIRYLGQSRRLEKLLAAQSGTSRSDVPEERLEANESASETHGAPRKALRNPTARIFSIGVTLLS